MAERAKTGQYMESSSVQIFVRCLFLFLLLGLLGLMGVDLATGQELLPDDLRKRLSSMPDNTDIGIVVLNGSGQTVFRRNAATEMPVASAIKPAILLELFDRYDQQLSSSPEASVKILSDPKHLAMAHFPEASRQEMVAALSGASIKRLGWIMIDQHDEAGQKYSNVTYNGATNLAIALLGGPAETTRAIHARDQSFLGLTVNRYMLANRTDHGDNTATPMAIASLHRKISSRQLANLSTEVLDDVHRILHTRDFPKGAKLHSKGGSLSSDPVTCVRAGWYQERQTTMIFAIMCSQPIHSSESGKTQYRALADLADSAYGDLKSAFFAR